MISRFGECPNCGTERMYASQSICSICCHAMPVPEPAAPASAAPFSRGAMAPAVLEPVPGAAAQSRGGSWLGLLVLLVGLAVFGGGLAFLYPMLTKDAGGAGAASAGAASAGAASAGASITFEPATISCATAPQYVYVTFRLPASYSVSDRVLFYVDGGSVTIWKEGDMRHYAEVGTELPTLGQLGFEKQGDGTWTDREPYMLGKAACGEPTMVFSVGGHLWRILDSDGKEIVSAPLTVKP